MYVVNNAIFFLTVEISYDLLQEVCDKDSTINAICLLSHWAKLGLPLHFDKPLKVCSEKMFDTLGQFGFPDSDIIVEWTDKMIASLFSNRETGEYDEVVIRRFCHVISIIRPDGQMEFECKGEGLELKVLLFACIKFGRTNETKVIISSVKTLLNSKNDRGETPIMYAAQRNQREIVRLLAEERPDISIASDDGTCLVDLIQDWEEVVQELEKVNTS